MRRHSLIVLLLVCAAAIGAAAPAAAPNSGDGLIAFGGARWSGDGSSATESLYVIRPDGGGLRRVIRGASGPAWSADGRRLAFARMFARGWRLYVANADSTHAHAITGYDPDARSPSWSPDGRSIAFVRLPRSVPGLSSYGEQIYIVGANGRGLRRVTSFSTFRTTGRPAWSPDGRRILFSGRSGSGDKARTDVWSVRPGGGGLRRIISSGYDPAWSPDGHRIAFVRRGDIYTATASGGDIRRLTATRGVEDGAPDWAPDGTQLVFASLRRHSDHAKDDQRLTIVQADGKGPRAITDTDPNFWADAPSWRAAP